MNDVNVFSNWSLANEEKLIKVITYCSSESKECNIDNLTIDSCVCLMKNDHFQPTPELEIRSKNLLQQVDVYSEGSLIEVFGINSEYLFTCECDFIDDWEGMAVYHAKINLPCISSCKLQFKRIKENNRLWIYNVHLAAIQSKELLNQTPFNFENVNKLINGSSQQISEKAAKFKKFFESYVSNPSQTRNFSSQLYSFPMLLSTTSKDYNMSFQVSAKNFVQPLGDITISNKGDFENTNLTENISKHKNALAHSYLLEHNEIELLKKYIDEKLHNMKEEILKCVETKLIKLTEENNLKLEKIITLLENAKLSF